MKTITILLSVFFFASTLSAQTVVENTNVSFSFGTQYSGTVFQTPESDPASADPTAVIFDYSNDSLTAVNWYVDEESDWYVVEAGDTFSGASIAANQHTPIFTTDNPRGAIFVGNTTFYLGINTGVGFTSGDSFIPNRDVYGWVQLQNNSGVLEVVSSAVAYGGSGIVVGTATAVSESLLCDVNLDGELNFLDIAPFIAALTSGTYLPEADCNQDGEVNFLDIAPFIAVLAGS